MDPLWILLILLGVVGVVVLGVSFVRLDKALRQVRRSLQDLSEAVPPARQVRDAAEEWRAAVDRTRYN